MIFTDNFGNQTTKELREMRQIVYKTNGIYSKFSYFKF